MAGLIVPSHRRQKVRHNAHGAGPSGAGYGLYALPSSPRRPSGAAAPAAYQLGAIQPTGQLNVQRYGGSFDEMLAQYAPAVNAAVQQITDPVRQYEKAKARYDNAVARGASASRLRVLAAELAAARQKAEQYALTVESGREWQSGVTRNLWVVTIVGGALVVFIGAAAYRQARRSPKKNPGRRRRSRRR